MAHLGKMDNWEFFLLLQMFFSLHCIVARGASFLPGSCVAAGYTECCYGDDPCPGDTGACFCNPTCLQFDDCCADIFEICRNPEFDSALESLRPVVTFVANITYHTASLKWITTASPNATTVPTNGSYTLSLKGAPNSEEGHWSDTNISIPIRSGRRVYSTELLDLDKNMTYTYKITVISNVGTVESAAGGVFSTRAYPSMENIHLAVIDASSISMSWFPPPLPEGVLMQQCKIYYREKQEVKRSFDSILVHNFTDDIPHGVVISSLKSDRLYEFKVAAVILDRNSVLYEFGNSSSAAEVFIPGSTYVQLVASSTLPCANWNVDSEHVVRLLLRSHLADLIQTKCVCSYPDHLLQDESLILQCTERNQHGSVTSASRFTYRAALLSTALHTAEELTILIASNWNYPITTEHGNFSFSLNMENCPVRIRAKSAPLCPLQSNDLDFSGSTQTLTVSLLAGFLLILCVVAGVLITALMTLSRKRRWCYLGKKQNCSNSSINNSSTDGGLPFNSSAPAPVVAADPHVVSSNCEEVKIECNLAHINQQRSVKYIL